MTLIGTELYFQSVVAEAAREYTRAYKRYSSDTVRERAQKLMDASYAYLEYLKKKEEGKV